MKLARLDRSLLARGLPRRALCDPFIEPSRVRQGGDEPSGVAPILLFAPSGKRVRVAPCSASLRRVRFGPTQGPCQSASLAFGVCHSRLPVSSLPVTGFGFAFLPRQGLAVAAFRG